MVYIFFEHIIWCPCYGCYSFCLSTRLKLLHYCILTTVRKHLSLLLFKRSHFVWDYVVGLPVIFDSSQHVSLSFLIKLSRASHQPLWLIDTDSSGFPKMYSVVSKTAFSSSWSFLHVPLCDVSIYYAFDSGSTTSVGSLLAHGAEAQFDFISMQEVLLA